MTELLLSHLLIFDTGRADAINKIKVQVFLSFQRTTLVLALEVFNLLSYSMKLYFPIDFKSLSEIILNHWSMFLSTVPIHKCHVYAFQNKVELL